MFLRTSTYKSTGGFFGENASKVFPVHAAEEDKTLQLKKELETADAVVIGAGAGLSASAGMSYSGERFEKNFFDFHQKYGITDMYSGGFYPFDTLEEYWAWWSSCNLYVVETGMRRIRRKQKKGNLVTTYACDPMTERGGTGAHM